MIRTGPPPSQVVVGVDVGTTAAKVVAFGVDTPWRSVAVREYPLLEPEPGWRVQDPDAVMAATLSALAECVADTGGAEVLAVSLSTAMHGLIGLDAAMRPLTPLVTWADTRGADEARWLRSTDRAEVLRQATGTPVHPMTPLVKLMWFSRQEPELCASARWWVGLKDYLLLQLTGTLATELSSASATGMLDVTSRAWSADALELAGVLPHQLPTILSPTATLGLSPSVATRIGLDAGTTVVAGAADGPLGNVGTGALSAGEASLSLGTSGAVRMVLPKPQLDDEAALFCYALTEDAWVVGGAVSNGGNVVRWAGRALAPDLRAAAPGVEPDEAVLRLAERVPAGSEGLLMLPYLASERAPLWDPDMSGAYLGLRSHHGRAHLVRAAVEGVCLQLSTIVDCLETIQPVTSMSVTGGAFRAPLWRQVMASVLDRPLHAAGSAEGSALGAAALGLVAVGRTADLRAAVATLADPATSPPVTIQPDPDAANRYRELRAASGDLVASLGRATRLLAPARDDYRDRRTGRAASS